MKLYELDDILGKEIRFEGEHYTIIDEITEMDVWVCQLVVTPQPNTTIIPKLTIIDRVEPLTFVKQETHVIG